MTNNKENKLFGEFPPVSTQQWEAVITSDLKGADYDKKLVWKTAEGFSVQPYYRAQDLEGVKFIGSGIGQFPYVRGNKNCNKWKIHQTIVVDCPKTANTTALRAIEGGATSLGFNLPKKEFSATDLSDLLHNIGLNTTEITFCGCGAKTAVDHVLVAAKDLDPSTVKINFTIDPIIRKLTLKGSMGCCEEGEKCIQVDLKEIIEKVAAFPKMRVVGINGHHFHNSGSTIVQELAFTLAVGHEYVVRLLEAGLDIDQVAGRMRFSMAVSSNYFMEIAKFRAARMLWANILAPYQPQSPCASKMWIHAVTSSWNMTAYDPYVNMLRGTTEAMSASIGGVHSLEVLPFDNTYTAPSEFSSRIARNTQLLLKHESHIDQVVDPAGGSYYIETLTQNIAQQAWELFKQVEEKGGYIASFKAGFVQETIEKAAAAKDQNIATRRQILLGTNQYPNFTEVADGAVTQCTVTKNSAKSSCCCTATPPPAGVRPLRPYRGAMAFEELRLRVDRSDKEPAAFMLTCGTLSFARARAQFACNFFACGGIRTVDNTYFHSVEVGVQQALDAKAQIIVICASDDDYATIAPKVAQMIGGKAILVIAGAPACAAELEAVGIKNFINVKSNVLETLKFYVKELGL